MKPLLDRVYIVTGGSAGIGLGTARILGERGAKVVIAELRKEGGERAVKELQQDQIDARFVSTDVSDETSVSQMVQATVAAYGHIDGLVNNVGISYRQAIEEVTAESWNHVLQVNLTGMFHCVRLCQPHLQRSSHAAIVNITSVNAYRTVRRMGAYPATKAGIIGLTHSLALDLAPRIRVNAVAPGLILTETWKNQVGDVEAALAKRMPHIPRERVGQPEDIGKAVAFLLSDEADYITGTVLRVDGGMLSQLYPLD